MGEQTTHGRTHFANGSVLKGGATDAIVNCKFKR